MHKELAVSLGSSDWRVDPSGHLAVRSNQRSSNLRTHSLMDCRIPNDPAAAIHFGLAGLELRLDEQHQLSAWSARGEKVRQCTDDGDE